MLAVQQLRRLPCTEPVVEAAPEPVAKVTAAKPDTPATADDIPDLIQDTLPDLEVLSPALADSAKQQNIQKMIEPETPVEADASEPNLEAAQVEAPGNEVPEWERDPTLAQLRPDLDALEHAMAVAQGLASDSNGENGAEQGNEPEEPAEPVPEIILDRQIQVKVDIAAAALKEEEEKRVAAEEAAEEESLIDNRPTAEILADAKAKEEASESRPKTRSKRSSRQIFLRPGLI